MDGLRKLVSGRLRTQVVGPHPDPDVLAAFAENALVQGERAQLLQHLGACDDCREILYLAAPDSAAAQKVLSFQPKPRSGLVFRWGALAASLVIVGVAVTARHPQFHAARQRPEAAASPVPSYPNVADEKAPSEGGAMRDRLTPQPAPQMPSKERRPEAKHMTAKPQASMEFDDSGQVRVSPAPMADQRRKSRSDDLSVKGRNFAVTAPAREVTPPTPLAAASVLAKDKADVAGGSASLDLLTAGKTAGGNLGGTILDSSGAVVVNAKVTTVGPVGAKTATSDPEGKFAFTSLTPGTYSIKAEANGFKSSEVTNLIVLDNKPATVGVRLEPGSAAETVEVSAAAVPMKEDARADAAPSPATMTEFAGGQGTGSMLQKAVATNAPPQMKTVTIAQWRLSAEGAVQKSLDSGHSWQKVVVSRNAAFRSLCSVRQHVWVGGNTGALFHSVDSGQTWNQVQPSAADQKLTSNITHIEFSDPANGSVSTTNGEVWITSDGGRSWRRK